MQVEKTIDKDLLEGQDTIAVKNKDQIDLVVDEDISNEPSTKAVIEEISLTEAAEEPRKERARETISFLLVFGLLALFFASFVFAGTVDDAIKLIQAVASALTGLIGAVLGYYFGATTAEKKNENK